MKSLQDALYNWLTIKVVCDARPEDTAAKETLEFFDDMLTNQHHVSNLETTTDEMMYYLSYQQGEEIKKARYPRELIEIMLDQINNEPEKYENYPTE
jgi:CRISPR/Cas system CSM-associated protein Csm2 small subunit